MGAVLELETEKLKTGGTQNIEQFQPEKQELTRHYLETASVMRNNAGVISSHAPAEIDRLRVAQTTFQDILDSNLTALNAARATVHSVLSAIFEIVSERNAGPQTYHGGAGMAQSLPHQPAAISLDRTL